jgi:hypothetical protein
VAISQWIADLGKMRATSAKRQGKKDELFASVESFSCVRKRRKTLFDNYLDPAPLFGRSAERYKR